MSDPIAAAKTAGGGQAVVLSQEGDGGLRFVTGPIVGLEPPKSIFWGPDRCPELKDEICQEISTPHGTMKICAVFRPFRGFKTELEF